jgi:hypothetical protein
MLGGSGNGEDLVVLTLEPEAVDDLNDPRMARCERGREIGGTRLGWRRGRRGRGLLVRRQRLGVEE